MTDKHDSNDGIDEKELDVNESLFQTNVLDSIQFKVPNEEPFQKCDCSDFIKVDLDMRQEQTRLEEISEIRPMITSGKENKDVQNIIFWLIT